MNKPTSRRKGATVTGPRVSQTGRETWQIVSDGESRTFITSESSARSMDEAVRRFGKALKRLADE